jgi:tRNA pseudouridine13 synthase
MEFDSCWDGRKLPSHVSFTGDQYPKVTTHFNNHSKVTNITRQFSFDFPFAQGEPEAAALFRTELEDFQVYEELGFSFSGEGEHLCLQIEKRGENTHWIAQLLAQFYGVDEVAIGYCGLKDRRAVTRQWFSVHLPNTDEVNRPELPSAPQYQLLSSARHCKKLRRGIHEANRFVIRLRQVQGGQEATESRLQQVVEQGVPNYFGEQRFGINGGNLLEADRLLAEQYGANRHRGRGKRSSSKGGSPKGGLYLSAARSYLFNLVLAERIRQGCWASPLEGEDKPAGPLWGRGRSGEPAAVREIEEAVLSSWQDWTNSMEFSGLQQERRPLVLHPEGLSWQWYASKEAGNDNMDLELSFALPSGGYATSVLREMIQLQVL